MISERPIDRAEVMLNARVVGGIRMIDIGEADDKIVAVLEGDAVWSDAEDIDALPKRIVERLVHYFLTYKVLPGEESKVSVPEVYDKKHAFTVVEAAMADYDEAFAG